MRKAGFSLIQNLECRIQNEFGLRDSKGSLENLGGLVKFVFSGCFVKLLNLFNVFNHRPPPHFEFCK